jgi:hypothetical protein
MGAGLIRAEAFLQNETIPMNWQNCMKFSVMDGVENWLTFDVRGSEKCQHQNQLIRSRL